MPDPIVQTVEVVLPDSLKKLGENLEAIRAGIAKLEGAEPPTPGILTPELTLLKADFAKAEKELADARTELQKQLDVTNKELADSRAEVVKVRLARRRELFIKRVQQLPHLPGAPADDFAEILEKIEGSVEPKQFEKLNTLLTSWNAIIEKSKVFEEIGRTEVGSFTGAEGQLVAFARELAATEKISFEKAYSRVLLERPELYQRYRAEKKER